MYQERPECGESNDSNLSLNSLKSEILKQISNIELAIVQSFTRIIIQAAQQKKTLYIFGNGASASLANHFVTDLNQLGQGQSSAYVIRAISLSSNVSLLTALANDYGSESIFLRQLQPLLNPGDIVIGISVSGKSSNVIRALRFAKSLNAVPLGLTGSTGTRLCELCATCFVVGSSNPLVVETVHLCFSQLVLASLR